MQKGFISIPILVIAVLGVALVGGGSFVTYKYSQVVKEKQQIESELVAQKDKEITDSNRPSIIQQEEIVKVEDIASTTETNTNNEMATDGVFENKQQVKEVIKTVIEYVPINVPVTADDNNPTSPAIEIPKEEKVIPKDDTKKIEVIENNPISVVSVGQTAFPDEYGGVYGSYGLTLRVRANTEDIYIPMTTNDSLGTGEIGFSYRVAGQEFRGNQDSKVTECTNFSNNLCKFKVGQDKNIKVTVWLIPDKDSSGNFSVNFGTVTYFEGKERKQFVVDRETASINLYY